MGVENAKAFADALHRFTGVVVPEAARALQEMVGREAVTRIKQRTPVDTGRLRGNWQFGLGSIPSGTVEGTADPFAGIIASIAAAPAYSLIVIANNLEYAETVEFGGYVPKDPVNSPEANKRRASSRSKPKQADIASRFGDPGFPLVRGGYSIRAPEGMVNVTFGELLQLFNRPGATEKAGKPGGAPNGLNDDLGRSIRKG